jgi:hypothetical protein
MTVLTAVLMLLRTVRAHPAWTIVCMQIALVQAAKLLAQVWLDRCLPQLKPQCLALEVSAKMTPGSLIVHMVLRCWPLMWWWIDPQTPFMWILVGFTMDVATGCLFGLLAWEVKVYEARANVICATHAVAGPLALLDALASPLDSPDPLLA